jgi:hypothetical protein
MKNLHMDTPIVSQIKIMADLVLEPIQCQARYYLHANTA